MQTPHIVTGVVLGKDLRVPCRVKVQVETAPFFMDSPFTECTVEESPYDFPDGTYEVRFLDQAARLRHENGQWREGILWESAT